jgi:hypothetical protein
MAGDLNGVSPMKVAKRSSPSDEILKLSLK